MGHNEPRRDVPRVIRKIIFFILNIQEEKIARSSKQTTRKGTFEQNLIKEAVLKIVNEGYSIRSVA